MRCCARLSASFWNSSLRDTKSVSEFSSRSTAWRPSGLVRLTMRPSEAVRSTRLSAFAMPFLRRFSAARSMSPFASSSAFLQSIMPAPVRWRSSEIIFGVTFAMVLVCLIVETPPASAAGGVL
jgi:hypothetical protein